MDGAADEFWEIRSELYPELTPRQRAVLSCYYRTRRDTHGDDRVTRKDFLEAAQSIEYETDCAATLMQNLDDHYLHLRLENMKRKAKKS